MTKVHCPDRHCHNGQVPCDGYGCDRGHIKCPACDTHGTVQCRQCHGPGYTEDYTGSRFQEGLYVGCPGCHGSGRGASLNLIRPGTGREPCEARGCHQGKIPCPTCHGKTTIDHKECHGTGWVDDGN